MRPDNPNSPKTPEETQTIPTTIQWMLAGTGLGLWMALWVGPLVVKVLGGLYIYLSGVGAGDVRGWVETLIMGGGWLAGIVVALFAFYLGRAYGHQQSRQQDPQTGWALLVGGGGWIGTALVLLLL